MSHACMPLPPPHASSSQKAASHTRKSSSLVSSERLVTRTLFSSRRLFILSPTSPGARFRRLGGTYPPVFAPAAGRLLIPPGPSCSTHVNWFIGCLTQTESRVGLPGASSSCTSHALSVQWLTAAQLAASRVWQACPCRKKLLRCKESITLRGLSP